MAAREELKPINDLSERLIKVEADVRAVRQSLDAYQIRVQGRKLMGKKIENLDAINRLCEELVAIIGSLNLFEPEALEDNPIANKLKKLRDLLEASITPT